MKEPKYMTPGNVCRECKHCYRELIVESMGHRVYAFDCLEDMNQFGQLEGCYRFEQVEDDRDV